MTLGRPVEPLLQMPLACGEMTSGRSGTVVVGGGVDPRDVLLAEVDLAVDRLAEPVELPLGQVPAHRDRHRAELPRGERGEDEVRGVAQADRQPVAVAEAPGGERAGELARCGACSSAQVKSCSVPSAATYITTCSSARSPPARPCGPGS